MKPVAIFRHSPTEGPGYFAIFLEQHGIPWTLIAIDDNDPIPASSEAFSGLCLMGGPMSVNDPLPWIEPLCALLRDAVARGLPIIGHCLGGQLLSKALGGTVTTNPVKEIGWSEGYGESHDIARHWLGELAGRPARIFQWHGETFSLPAGSARIMGNPWCANQMYALGPHLGMQCHIEMTPEIIASWCEQWAEEAAAVADLPSVQTPAAMLEQIPVNLPAMRQLSDQLYAVWIAGLTR